MQRQKNRLTVTIKLHIRTSLKYLEKMHHENEYERDSMFNVHKMSLLQK